MRNSFCFVFFDLSRQGWNFTGFRACGRFVAATSTFIVSLCKLLLQHYLARLASSPPDACWKSMTFHVACHDIKRKGFESWFHFYFRSSTLTPIRHQTPTFSTLNPFHFTFQTINHPRSRKWIEKWLHVRRDARPKWWKLRNRIHPMHLLSDECVQSNLLKYMHNWIAIKTKLESQLMHSS